MNPTEVAERLGEVLPQAGVTSAHGVVTATVERTGWVPAVAAARTDAALDGTYFDVLLGTDLGGGTLEVLVRLWSVAGRHGFHLRTTCPAEDPHLPSLAAVVAGAAWYERETAEMLGVVFDGHPGLTHLLLSPDDGHPLRKDVVLAERLAQPWPGAVEPGESAPNPRRRPHGLPGAERPR